MAIDFDTLFGGDDYDPCEALRALRPAYMKLIAGESIQKIVFRDRDLWTHKGEVDALRGLIAQLESECAASKGVTITRRRMAITGGFRRA